MNANKALWEKGDFTQIAESMRDSGEALVKELGITNGIEVLDLGCGDGTTALPAARLGAEVLGGRHRRQPRGRRQPARRGAKASPTCRFEEGDASRPRLHRATSRSTSSSAIFGAMFAPNPFDVAKEMVRVTRPGGRIVMGNWIPGDPTLVAQLLRISAAYSPPPPEGFVSPVTWGVEENVVERFTAAGVRAAAHHVRARHLHVRRPRCRRRELVAAFRDYYGPTMNAFAAAEANGRADDL